MPSLIVNGVPYQYETEANAGVSIATGARWWGTLVKYRSGIAGKWSRVNVIDVHPFDVDAVKAALCAYIESGRG